MYAYEARRDAIAAAVMMGLVAFAMLVPPHLYSPPSAASDTLRVACGYVPFLCQLAASTSTPPITRSALILSVAGAFIAAPSYIYWFMKGKPFEAVRGNIKLMATGWIFLIFALFPFFPGSARTSPSKLELLLLAASQSRIGLAVFSIYLFIAELALLLGCAVWLKCLFAARRR